MGITRKIWRGCAYWNRGRASLAGSACGRYLNDGVRLRHCRIEQSGQRSGKTRLVRIPSTAPLQNRAKNLRLRLACQPAGWKAFAWPMPGSLQLGPPSSAKSRFFEATSLRSLVSIETDGFCCQRKLINPGQFQAHRCSTRIYQRYHNCIFSQPLSIDSFVRSN
jgi:hypothetical protein